MSTVNGRQWAGSRVVCWGHRRSRVERNAFRCFAPPSRRRRPPVSGHTREPENERCRWRLPGLSACDGSTASTPCPRRPYGTASARQQPSIPPRSTHTGTATTRWSGPAIRAQRPSPRTALQLAITESVSCTPDYTRVFINGMRKDSGPHPNMSDVPVSSRFSSSAAEPVPSRSHGVQPMGTRVRTPDSPMGRSARGRTPDLSTQVVDKFRTIDYHCVSQP